MTTICTIQLWGSLYGIDPTVRWLSRAMACLVCQWIVPTCNWHGTHVWLKMEQTNFGCRCGQHGTYSSRALKCASNWIGPCLLRWRWALCAHIVYDMSVSVCITTIHIAAVACRAVRYETTKSALYDSHEIGAFVYATPQVHRICFWWWRLAVPGVLRVQLTGSCVLVGLLHDIPIIQY